MSRHAPLLWTFVVTSLAAFMVSLDNLVVSTALPSIRADLGAGLEGLEWTVNAYTLTFGVLLLTGAALGERYGRRRTLVAGLALFTVSSALAALAPGIGALVAARAAQGVGAALVMPLTLTILSAAVPPQRRGAALGVWGAVTGIAIAVGPLVGGAVVEGWAWQWIFWLNVPIGLVLVPVALLRLPEQRTSGRRALDLPGLALATLGLVGLVLGLVRGNGHGWTSAGVLGSLAAGALLLLAFVAWEARTAEPMVPLGMFRSRGYTAANVLSLLFSFGVFGSIFLLAQFLQTVQGSSPFEAGLKTLPWTAMPLLVAPVAGPLSDRVGGRPLLLVGLVLQAAGLGWFAATLSTSVSYAAQVPAFVLAGIGMGLVFVPLASVVLGAADPAYAGVASGTNTTFREIGGVFGVAVLGTVFSSTGGYGSPQAFVDGIVPALWVGVAVVLAAAACAVLLPGRRATAVVPVGEPVLAA
ncbi:EmrB/QacA subfamily drug resistance transporter [Motilibacter rhizosphaerae]|uniref:EmrB/QacA subfamily drug resistance transporter n=1 Tax=Motilibacter rhizosphaerae TaxID=598652 RepID=A0A4Q7NNI3_9ACTN|nr:DHA2 family efflux MFS transporter permease subunit [Motilibacter rhizosphaerae]RZS86804.1 EmrB/QacA subfamily drug resistance transporter [Motilibacter rhizosphaerae]